MLVVQIDNTFISQRSQQIEVSKIQCGVLYKRKFNSKSVYDYLGIGAVGTFKMPRMSRWFLSKNVHLGLDKFYNCWI